MPRPCIQVPSSTDSVYVAALLAGLVYDMCHPRWLEIACSSECNASARSGTPFPLALMGKGSLPT